MESTIRGRKECVQFAPLSLFNAECDSLVTDMLIAILNTCSKEELDEATEEDPEDIDAEEAGDSTERRRVIKNKILAVGKMAKVFAVLRCVTVTLTQTVYLILLTLSTGRRQNEYPNSRIYPPRTTCHMAHWCLGRKVSRMQSRTSMMRM